MALVTSLKLAVVLLSAMILPPVLALPLQGEPPVQPRIAIVIDDLGHHQNHFDFVELSFPVTLAIMPFTPKAEALATSATRQGHEVIIHMPMQAEHRDEQRQGELDRFDTPAQFLATLNAAFSRLPQAKGLNNHQGSRLTAEVAPMQLLMKELTARQLYFLDSRTTTATQAEELARTAGIPALRRHVFLDNEPHLEAIKKEWSRLLDIAAEQGFAVAIGHPYPATLEFLQQHLPQLAEQGQVELVYLSELLPTPR
ncbi:divergent polysaccharide deacetylase family protein [Pseudidiomarina sp. 1ASP75-14]|uniref:divergent polysaccharide deacetylase family protein n=1 Tax=Pseudidiomarina terrestris TaxID=2820060 RepID=UPI002655D889|nr:divergent polysaccharide deacetylase family protein [Pseudidiomarina sp. 1ASP75-14]MDN7137126.1 divergent polysaccharide deacetylase family protein [Pseudidiomarina sp. 1ASP75-14]